MSEFDMRSPGDPVRQRTDYVCNVCTIRRCLSHFKPAFRRLRKAPSPKSRASLIRSQSLD
jgi:hypothetical protein